MRYGRVCFECIVTSQSLLGLNITRMGLDEVDHLCPSIVSILGNIRLYQLGGFLCIGL